jgi:hypothetical protein
MTDYTKDEMEKYLKYVQKKERMISALNYAIRTAQAPIYAEVLNELIMLVVEDKLLPDSINTQLFEDLYPHAQKKTEDKDVQ